MSSKAQRCPVCGGSGKYQHPDNGHSTAPLMPETCHGCNGKGWVTVSDDNSEWPRVPPISLEEPIEDDHWQDGWRFTR